MLVVVDDKSSSIMLAKDMGCIESYHLYVISKKLTKINGAIIAYKSEMVDALINQTEQCLSKGLEGNTMNSWLNQKTNINVDTKRN